MTLSEINQDEIFICKTSKHVFFKTLSPVPSRNKKEDLSRLIWSIGLLFLKMASILSKVNFNQLKLIQMVSDGNAIDEIEISKTAWNLLKKLLIKDPRKRISAKEALLHEWINENPE